MADAQRCDACHMAHNPEAMSELKQILLEREPLYRKADLTLDTSHRGVDAILRELTDALAQTV